MTGKTVDIIKKSLIEEFKKDFPGESVYGKVFSLYLLSRYANLLYKIYKRTERT